MSTQGAFEFEAAQTRLDLGIERSAARADRASPGWVDRAVAELALFAALNIIDEFTIEDARAALKLRGKLEDPTDGRAWGQVTRRAVMLGWIQRVPGKFKAAVSSNGSPKQVYRRGVML